MEIGVDGAAAELLVQQELEQRQVLLELLVLQPQLFFNQCL